MLKAWVRQGLLGSWGSAERALELGPGTVREQRMRRRNDEQDRKDRTRTTDRSIMGCGEVVGSGWDPRWFSSPGRDALANPTLLSKEFKRRPL